MFIICWILPYLLYPHPNPLALFFFLQTKRHHRPLKTLPCKHTNHLHACAQLGKHWPSTLHWVREWWWFRSAWWSLSWKCEGDKIKIAIRRVGIEHGEQREWERVKSRRVQRETAEHEATEQRTGGGGGGIHSAAGRQLLHRRSTGGSELAHLQTWPWLRCTGPPSPVWCSGPSRAAALCVPRSGSCPPGDTRAKEKVWSTPEKLLEWKICFRTVSFC